MIAIPKVSARCALLLIAVSCTPLTAQTSTNPEAIIEQSIAFAKSVDTAYGDVLSTVTTGQGSMNNRSQVWADMPDKLVSRMINPDGTAVTMYVDGAQQTIYIQKLNKFAKTPVTAGDAASQLLELLSAGLGGSGMLADKSGTRQLTFVGKENLAGVPTNHLRVVNPGGATGDVWIADGPQPLPVYVRMSQPQPPLSGETFYRWTLGRSIPPTTFQFTPPAGATDMKAPRKTP